MKEIKLTARERRAVEFIATAADFLQDNELRNMMYVKIKSRATAAIIGLRK